MSRARHIIEGEWSGYTSAQRHVVHRTVTTRPDVYRGLHSIIYTDGTSLTVTVRPCRPRERVHVIDGYSELINKAARHAPGQRVVRVADLQ